MSRLERDPDPADRRGHHRYQLRLPVNLHADRWSRGLIVDLSRSGICVAGATATARIGQRVRLSLKRYGGGQCVADGKVVRVVNQPHLGGFAIEFDRNTPTMASLIDAAERLPPRDRDSYLATELRPTVEITGIR